MLTVYDVARHVFWNDSMYDRKLLPPESALEKCTYSLTDLATMTGRERISAFKECGIDESLFPLFLRSLQHVTSLHGPGSIDDGYLIHRHLSARQWSPFSYSAPLLGYPSVVSQAYREQSSTKIVERPANEDKACAMITDSGDHYNGLLNQGATCYLNSILQALFHISEFRSIIYQMPTKEEAEELSDMDPPVAKSIPYALQRLFCMLQTATKAVGTTELTESFGWSEADSFIQHDVHELTRVLLDNLEKKLNVQNPDESAAGKLGRNAIDKLFHGSLETYVNVDEVGYHGSRDEPFYDLQLVVKNKKDIYASFDSFFQVEVLDGKNKYCLERDGEKTYHRAEKGVRFKKIPPVLLLHLARFDYDWEQGETKIFSRWDFYSTLDLSRYMPQCRSEETHYTLCSVLVHSGSNTGFGHYYCFLLCSGQWYKFNDETVTPATLKEVFGSNFGGFKMNYWGSEVPQISTAYMLVYIRTCEVERLLRPIGAADVPRHVVEQLQKEQIELDRKLKERSEDYLYGRVHFIQPAEINDQEGFLTYRSPPNHKFSSHRTLRVLLEAEALPAFTAFATRVFGCKEEAQLLWYVSPRSTASTRMRLFAQVKPGVKVSDVLAGGSECSVLVTTPDNVPLVDLNEEGNEYQLFHHKLYDPLLLKLYFLGCTVVKRSPDGNAKEAIKQMEPHIRNMVAQLPDESRRFHMHHITGHKNPSGMAKRNTSFPAGLDGSGLQRDNTGKETGSGATATPTPIAEGSGAANSSTSASRRGPLSGELMVVREDELRGFLECDALQSGDFLVWQPSTPAELQENVFYPDVESFQHFLRHRIPVEIRLNLPPSYPTLIKTEMANDMTYEQLQRYVGYLIGEPSNYDRIRFTRHNPETELPYFMKGKKRDRPTLEKLLTPANNRINVLSKYLYYEYCKYTVTEIESAHSLQFKLYCDCVKAVSSHWILMPREVPITAEELFSTCVREIQADYASGAVSLPKATNGDELSENNSKIRFIEFIQSVKAEDAWKVLRLADVWRGRVYNILDHDHALVFEHQTFEESAEYRIERIPQPIQGVPAEEQFLVPVNHFTVIRQRKDPVETHSEPFFIYVLNRESPEELLRRIASKLELSFAAVVDWKVCLVKENRVVQTKPDIPMGVQLLDFCEPENFAPNQKDPTKSAFLGLEHAPIAKRGAKREDKVVILN